MRGCVQSLVYRHPDPDDSNLLLVGSSPVGSALPGIRIYSASQLHVHWPWTPQGSNWYGSTAQMRRGVEANYNIPHDVLYRMSPGLDREFTQSDVDDGGGAHGRLSWDCWASIP